MKRVLKLVNFIIYSGFFVFQNNFAMSDTDTKLKEQEYLLNLQKHKDEAYGMVRSLESIWESQGIGEPYNSRIALTEEERRSITSVKDLLNIGDVIKKKIWCLVSDSQIPEGEEGYLSDDAYMGRIKDVLSEIDKVANHTKVDKARIVIPMSDIMGIDRALFETGFTLINQFLNDPDEGKLVETYFIDEKRQIKITYKKQ